MNDSSTTPKDETADHSHDDQTFGTPHSHPNKSVWHTRPLIAIAVIAVLAVATVLVNTNALRQSSGTKQVIQGLIDRSHAPTSSWSGHVAGFVVNVNWADLQTSAGAPITANNKIDQAIASTAGKNLAIKLRIFAGDKAPDWAKNIGGSPFTMRDPASGATGTVGRFWLPAFGAAWSDLQSKLAAKYDSAPAIREVTINRCTTIYAEPMIRQISDSASVKALLGAGYTTEQDHLCQTQQVDASQVWTTTHTDLSFNPYQSIDSSGKGSVDEAFTETMIAYCRQVRGQLCVLENNSLRSGGSGSTYDAMYKAIKSAGPPISFQTATIARVGSLTATLQLAVGYGANSVELPSGYETLNPSSLDQYSTALIANSTGPTPSPSFSPTPTPTPTPTTTSCSSGTPIPTPTTTP